MANKIREELKEKVNIEEVVMKSKIDSDKWRLNYHLMPPVGWLNDPNGLCEFRSKYHIFYQYSPLDPKGGNKFWGHYTSKNLIDWKKEEVALLPDEEFDKDGVYSGSAMVEDNKIYFFYTGNVKHLGNYDYIYKGRDHNTILVTSDDGVNFSEKVLLLKNEDYPSNMSCHVRDPKVWKDNNEYYMVIGARDKEDTGKILLYNSKDKNNWSLTNIIKSDEKLGYMWECPDFFKLDNKQVLLLCPQGIEPMGIDYRNIYQCGYFFLDGNIKNDYELSNFKELDRGFDMYAPQTFLDSKNRRILIGWMGMPDADYTNPTINNGWQHALTIPRELKVINHKLYQIPIEELNILRRNHRSIKVQKIIEVSNSYEMEINFNEEVNKLLIKLRRDVEVSFNNNLFSIKMGKSGYGRNTRSVKLDYLRNIRIFNDTSSIEIFINNGEEVFTTRVYDDLDNNYVYIEGDNIEGKIDIYDMDKFSYS